MRLDRIYKIALFFAICFTILAGRIYYLQGVASEDLKVMAENQRRKTVNIDQYPRGDFLDRNGRSLTGKNTPCLVIFPNVLAAETQQTASILADIIPVAETVIDAKLQAGIVQGKAPYILQTHLTEEQVGAIQSANLPGIFVLPLNARYDNANSAVHLLGFVGSIGPEEEAAYQEQGLAPPASGLVGKFGLEKIYDSYLQGKPHHKLAMTTDERGNPLSGFGWQYLPSYEEDQSHNVKLTIDEDVQLITARALADMQGAAVVMEVQTGDILALASSPRFDPYMNQEPPTKDAYINKALACYPPASVFKIVLSIAALEEKFPFPEDFTCIGYYALTDTYHVSCWNKKGHGPQNLATALANSCNPYFVNLGLKMGGDMIKKYAALLGLTEQNIIGYPFVDSTHIAFNSKIPGAVANASIGENGISLSPVQIAGLLSIVANGGYRVQPRLVKDIEKPDGTVVVAYPAAARERVIRSETAKTIQQYLVGAVQNGTASNAGGDLYVGGKTGTSENKGVWFAGFAPADEPRWAIVVYVSDGTAGGKEGAQVFKEISENMAKLENLL